MSVNWNYIFGATTIVVIIGGTIYMIKKSKDAKEQEEQAMTVAEARELLKSDTGNDVHDKRPELSEKEMEELIDDARDEASWNNSFSVPQTVRLVDQEEMIDKGEVRSQARVVSLMRDDAEDPDVIHDDEFGAEDETCATGDEGYGFYDDVDFDRPLAEYITEEDKVLRHEPNSIEAKQQYIKMELAEWVPMEETYQTLLKLFNFPFAPQNDGDHMLMTKIIDYRVQFFGFGSRWVKEVTFADIILYFAKLADYNCGNGVKYWVEYFLSFNEFNITASSRQVDDLLDALNAHKYYNAVCNTYGLFGLTGQYIDSAMRIAERNIDQSLTYEIEFNEFLKSCIQ